MPREVIDLWMNFNDPKIKKNFKTRKRESKKPPLYLEKILEIVLLAIEEQDFLEEEQQELLRGSFPTGFDAGLVETDRFDFRTKLIPCLKSKDLPESLILKKHLGWEIYIDSNDLNNDKFNSSCNRGKSAFSYLPPRQTAWIVLLHDLAWHWRQDKINENLAEKLCKSLVDKVKNPLLNANWVGLVQATK